MFHVAGALIASTLTYPTPWPNGNTVKPAVRAARSATLSGAVTGRANIPSGRSSNPYAASVRLIDAGRSISASAMLRDAP